MEASEYCISKRSEVSICISLYAVYVEMSRAPMHTVRHDLIRDDEMSCALHTSCERILCSLMLTQCRELCKARHDSFWLKPFIEKGLYEYRTDELFGRP